MSRLHLLIANSKDLPFYERVYPFFPYPFFNYYYYFIFSRAQRKLFTITQDISISFNTRHERQQRPWVVEETRGLVMHICVPQHMERYPRRNPRTTTHYLHKVKQNYKVLFIQVQLHGKKKRRNGREV